MFLPPPPPHCTIPPHERHPALAAAWGMPQSWGRARHGAVRGAWAVALPAVVLGGAGRSGGLGATDAHDATRLFAEPHRRWGATAAALQTLRPRLYTTVPENPPPSAQRRGHKGAGALSNARDALPQGALRPDGRGMGCGGALGGYFKLVHKKTSRWVKMLTTPGLGRR